MKSSRFYAPDAEETRPCDVCGLRFDPKGDWQRTCTRCWVAEKEERIRHEAFAAGRRAGLAEGRCTRDHGRDAGPFGDVTFVWELIQLAHPDRHPAERADVANRVTAVLIERLKRLREGRS